MNVSHPPDPSRVRVFGPGVEHGILSTYVCVSTIRYSLLLICSFKSNFIVETKGAGAGQLTVRVRGPKGTIELYVFTNRSSFQAHSMSKCNAKRNKIAQFIANMNRENRATIKSRFEFIIIVKQLQFSIL